MASAQYLYKISLEGGDALTGAQALAKGLEQVLGSIVIGKDLDISEIERRLKTLETKAGVTGKKAGENLARQMKAQMKRVTGTAKAWGLEGVTEALDRTSQKFGSTSKEMQAQLKDLEGRFIGFKKAVGKIGVDPEEWLGASKLDRAGMELQAAQRRVWGIRGFGAQVESYGRGMMAGGLGMLGGMAAAAKEYAAFAEPLGRAQRNLELNAQMAALLDRRLIELSGTMSLLNPQEQAEGLYLWAAATGEVVETSADMEALLQRNLEVQKLAALGVVSYGTAVEAVTDVQSQYGLHVEDTSDIVATFIKVAATSKAEVNDLAEAFRYVGSFAAATNTTFEETAAILQMLAAAGQRGSMAGRGVGRMLENLIAPSKQARGILDELFTDVFGRSDVLITATGDFVGMARAIQLLAEATEDLESAERAEVVARLTTSNAGRVMIRLLDQEIAARELGISAVEEQINILTGVKSANQDAFVSMMKDQFGYVVSTKSATKTLKDQWAELLESTDGRVKKVQASFDQAMISIGASVMESALPSIEILADALRDVGDIVSTHPQTVAGLMKAGGVVVAVGALVMALGKGIQIYADLKALAMVGTFSTAVAAFGIDVKAFAAAQAAGMMGRGVPIIPSVVPAAAAGGAMSIPGVAAIVGLGTLLFELTTRLETGRSILDLWNTEAEGIAAGFKEAKEYAEAIAELDDPGAEKQFTKDRMTALEQEKAALEEWLFAAQETQATLGAMPALGDAAAMAKYQDAVKSSREYYKILETVPEEYETRFGKVKIELIQEALTKVENQLEKVEQGWMDVAYAQARGTGEAYQYAVAVETVGEAVAEAQQAQQGRYQMDWATRVPTGAAAPMTSGIYTVEAQVPQAVKDLENWMDLAVEAGTYTLLDYEEVDKLRELSEVLGIDIDKLGVFIQYLGDTATVMSAFAGGPIQQAISLLRAYGDAIPESEELAASMFKDATAAWTKSKTLGGIMPVEDIAGMYDAYLVKLEEVYTVAEGMSRNAGELYIQAYQDAFNTSVQDHLDSQKEMERQTEQSAKNRQKTLEQAQQGLRRIIEQALEPTKVTAEDVEATEGGFYKDKWDEEVRRMKAAMAGSAKWKSMIPDAVWAAGPEAANEWGQNWIQQFYAGMDPDAIRWDVLLDSVVNALAQEAGQKNLVEEVVKRLAEERGITATSEQVLAALGMTGIMPMGAGLGAGMAAATPEAMAEQAKAMADSVIGPLTEELATRGMDEPAIAMVGALGTSVKDQMKEIDWTAQVHEAIKTNVKDQYSELEKAGRLIGDGLWSGIFAAFEDANIVHIIAQRVMQIMTAEVKQAAGTGTGAPAGGTTGTGAKYD